MKKNQRDVNNWSNLLIILREIRVPLRFVRAMSLNRRWNEILRCRMYCLSKIRTKKTSYKDISSITSWKKYLNRNTCTHLHVLFQYTSTRTVCQGKRGRIIYCAVTTYDIERPLFTVSVRMIHIHRLAFETSLVARSSLPCPTRSHLTTNLYNRLSWRMHCQAWKLSRRELSSSHWKAVIQYSCVRFH